MLMVERKNQHLWYLDIGIPTDFNQSNIKFNCICDDATHKIRPRRYFQKNLRGFYHIEEDNDDARKTRGWFNAWNLKSQIQKSSILILEQLINSIKNWSTYNHMMEILLSIRNIYTTNDLWKLCKKAMMEHYKIVFVFRLQLLFQTAVNDQLSFNIKELYHLIESFDEDSSFSTRKIGEKRQKQIGIAVYNSFKDIIQNLCKLRNNRISPADYLLLFSIFNFFKYFEIVKLKINKNDRNRYNRYEQLEFNNYDKYDEYFINNENWLKLNLGKMLNIDLDIGSFKNYHRMYPFENILFRLCSIRHNRGKNVEEMFKKILEIIASRGDKQIENIIIDIFNYDRVIQYIFNVASNDFNGLWKELIVTLNPQRIATNKRILNAFHENLKWQIGAMDNNNNKLKDLYDVIINFEGKYNSSQPLPKSKWAKAKKIETCKVCNKEIKSGRIRSNIHHCRFWYVFFHNFLILIFFFFFFFFFF